LYITLADIFILIGAGVIAGFAGGMLGLGGAFIMTPLQVIVYTNMGLSPDIAVKTAFGTSLLVVLSSALSGSWRHNREGAVKWRVALVMGCCGLFFGLIGATLASYLPGSALKIAFGAIAIASAARMLWHTRQQEGAEFVNKPWVWALWAIPIGFLSGILGVGGGILMVPVMVLVLKLSIQEAAANSLAVMIITSIGGIIGYIVNGIGVAGRLPYSLGYIDGPSWLMLAIPAALMAQLGALATHHLSRKWLTLVFVVVVLFNGLDMIGLFRWLGWNF
jgi:uncharacterized membrane protein YfcA